MTVQLILISLHINGGLFHGGDFIAIGSTKQKLIFLWEINLIFMPIFVLFCTSTKAVVQSLCRTDGKGQQISGFSVNLHAVIF